MRTFLTILFTAIVAACVIDNPNFSTKDTLPPPGPDAQGTDQDLKIPVPSDGPAIPEDLTIHQDMPHPDALPDAVVNPGCVAELSQGCGLTAVFTPVDNSGVTPIRRLVAISKDAFWQYRFTSPALWEIKKQALSQTWADAKSGTKPGPWEGIGVTATYTTPRGGIIVIQKDRFWEYGVRSNQLQWIQRHEHLSRLWPALDTAPWLRDQGVTAATYDPGGDSLTIFSATHYWLISRNAGGVGLPDVLKWVVKGEHLRDNPQWKPEVLGSPAPWDGDGVQAAYFDENKHFVAISHFNGRILLWRFNGVSWIDKGTPLQDSSPYNLP